IRPISRGWQVLRVSEWRAGINPTDNRIDLPVGQRPIVLEALDSNSLVNMPRRHVPRDNTFPDGFRPRAYLLIGDQRHRRRSSLSVTFLALCLKNWGDVL